VDFFRKERNIDPRVFFFLFGRENSANHFSLEKQKQNEPQLKSPPEKPKEKQLLKKRESYL